MLRAWRVENIVLFGRWGTLKKTQLDCFVRILWECPAGTGCIYSHRQNYRKKQNGKMPGYYPGNPQMIQNKVMPIGARVIYHCPGKNFL